MSSLPPGPDEPDGNHSPAITSTTSSFMGRPPLHRSVSRGSQWSAAETPRHHLQGTSYFPEPVSATPPTHRRSTQALRNASAGSRRQRPARSTSMTSSHATTLSEENEEENDNSSSSTSSDHILEEEADAEVAADAEDEHEHEEDLITLKDRQSLINVEHPFGLPIWKPALYKKSRSVTRYADQALHSVPSAQAERHLLPGNILWTVAFGWWLALCCLVVAAMLYVVPNGGRQYATLMFGLGWYIAWPFGKYVEGDPGSTHTDDEERASDANAEHPDGSEAGDEQAQSSSEADTDSTPRGDASEASHDTITPGVLEPSTGYSTIRPHAARRLQAGSWNEVPVPAPTATTALLTGTMATAAGTTPQLRPSKSYGATEFMPIAPPQSYSIGAQEGKHSDLLGKAVFRLLFILIIAPLMFVVSVICWALIFTIPMARLNWALMRYLIEQPTHIRFCAAPVVAVAGHQSGTSEEQGEEVGAPREAPVSFKPARLAAGQTAPFGSPTSTVLLCTYKAFGWKYYKYTVGGVNIIFVNLMAIVFFVILDWFVLVPLIERKQNAGDHVPGILVFLTSRALIFIMSLASVIPLSYFIGMAVASISAQSSIGMGAVINATFGSVIEVILYGIALTQGKGHLVEGSIVGSLLAGVLLMPGVSMCSGAVRTKEQKFNAKSAGVTSMLLIMAFIGTLAPTLFYQIYGGFQLVCDGCPSINASTPWTCQHCYYKHPDPVDDPFYQSTVKTFMFFCAVVLLLSYLIGLWFSLRTHASQIWQNPQQLLHAMEMSTQAGLNRVSLYQRLVPGAHSSSQHLSHPLQHKQSAVSASAESMIHSGGQTPTNPSTSLSPNAHAPVTAPQSQPSSSTTGKRISYANPPVLQGGLSPFIESVDHAMKDTGLHPTSLPENMTTDDFTRAVAVATVSALRHQQKYARSPARMRASAAELEGAGAHGGHDAPSWSRTTSASVLLACTALYAIIAELLVNVVDVVLEGSGIEEKFLGVTLFALVPNTTEFMNAISFAMNGNIALSMEIGSAYALQVCLLQIPAMVAFSAWYAPEKMGSVADTFTLIFPRWDVVVIILSVFLLTYTYIEAKSNYHRGSILILSYLVLISGFYFAPKDFDDQRDERVLIPYSYIVSIASHFLSS
ncbi:uncharacterized protein LAESUDRAFT_776211 [Laetiporus sulphureus 93-53]|uniref:Calcium permease n=1 Tax=Laetiporus sulphureus 93-53 TaxID=1314785 RepID=A0A165HNM5_9APHY|nr:uncharacterized protein LAESUDRAFT_776211 [Laetiporus sulphureus 93-53]KZT11976.1 hypothetical protein LAESUDRAFT_776211 [Laetiporus sulphureus 93-53]